MARSDGDTWDRKASTWSQVGLDPTAAEAVVDSWTVAVEVTVDPAPSVDFEPHPAPTRASIKTGATNPARNLLVEDEARLVIPTPPSASTRSLTPGD
jgi:hypothetical protein